MKLSNKLFTKGMAESFKDGDTKERLFVASDAVEDRHGEIIAQDGWNLKNYKANPVIQWAHNPSEPAIATAEKIGFRTVKGKKKLVYSPVFHRKTPMSNYIADLVDAGVIKASSVGFKPVEMDENIYTKAELLEISFVNVPANQNALSLGLSKGYSMDVIKEVMPDIKEEKEEEVIEEEKEEETEEEVVEDKKEEEEIKEEDKKEEETEEEETEEEDKSVEDKTKAEDADSGSEEVKEEETQEDISKEEEEEEKSAEQKIEELESTVLGLKEGFKTMDKEITDKIEAIKEDIKQYKTSQSEAEKADEKGVIGRDPKMVAESKEAHDHRLAMKALNRVVEILNKTK